MAATHIFTQDEAALILNLFDVSAKLPESSIVVLKKLQISFPELINGTKFEKVIEDFDRKSLVTKKQANEKIALIIKEIYTKFAEAEKIANETGVWFNFDMNGTYGMGGRYDGEEQRWVSSSEDC